MARRQFQFDDKAFKRSLEVELQKIKINSAEELLKLGYKVRNDAVRRTPVDTGRLRAAWQVNQGLTPTGPFVEIRNNVEYARHMEYGTRPHVIHAKNKQVLANRKTGQVFGRTVMHPGTRPHAMLRLALLENVRDWRPKIV